MTASSATAVDIITALACGAACCEPARRKGAGLVHCPAHDDPKPSLNVSEAAAGRALVHCHGGCSQDRVLAALRERGLWGSTAAPERRRIVATYSYVDETDTQLFQVIRYEPKGFAQRRQDAGAWSYHLNGTRRVLYRLPAVLAAARAGGRVYVVEGERDADVLTARGLCATTSPMGAGKWRGEYAGALNGAEVVLIADKDTPGRAHAEQVAFSCSTTAKSVRLLELPGDHVKDASDFLAAGGTIEEIERLADATAAWTASSSSRSVTALRDALTDLGNAERLVERHGAELRYCAALDAWYVWDGRRWAKDETGEVVRRATESVVALYAEAETLPDRTAREELVKHAVKSEADARIAAAIHLAQADARIALRFDAFDADPMALNVMNGTLDLRNGELHPHRRDDLITRLSPVAYDPEARLRLWEDFLITASGGDGDLLRYLERAAGYSLTGLTREEVLFLIWGPTGSGKSTYMEAVKAVLGEYGATADFETFLLHREGGPRNDIARLAGRRLVASIEMDEGRRLAEGLVKQLTGGDTIAARFLFRESFEFVPAFKLWLVANSKPRVSNEDGAMWRRIRLIPFEYTVPEGERDPELKAMLRDPAIGGPAVLAWAVRGCLAWQREGLRAPERVSRATDAYRQEMDVLADFLAERCELDPAATVPARALYGAYTAWAQEAGERRPLTAREFGLRMSARGVEAEKGPVGVRVRRGVRLREVMQ